MLLYSQSQAILAREPGEDVQESTWNCLHSVTKPQNGTRKKSLVDWNSFSVGRGKPFKRYPKSASVAIALENKCKTLFKIAGGAQKGCSPARRTLGASGSFSGLSVWTILWLSSEPEPPSVVKGQLLLQSCRGTAKTCSAASHFLFADSDCKVVWSELGGFVFFFLLLLPPQMGIAKNVQVRSRFLADYFSSSPLKYWKI